MADRPPHTYWFGHAHMLQDQLLQQLCCNAHAAKVILSLTPQALLLHRSPAVGDVYRSHIHYVTGRVNSFTGIAYKDDPTIMAWNLLNEPR